MGGLKKRYHRAKHVSKLLIDSQYVFARFFQLLKQFAHNAEQKPVLKAFLINLPSPDVEQLSLAETLVPQP